MSELVQKLSSGEHNVIVSLRPTVSAQAFKECLDRGFVLVKFTGTRGGTELGMKLDPQASDASGADFATSEGAVKLVGNLTLDYVDVRCVAEIDLKTLGGRGHLEPLQQAEAADARAER
jgi:hypothetical protein